MNRNAKVARVKHTGVMELKKITISACSCSDCMDHAVYRKCLKSSIDPNELIANLVSEHCMRQSVN